MEHFGDERRVEAGAVDSNFDVSGDFGDNHGLANEFRQVENRNEEIRNQVYSHAG